MIDLLNALVTLFDADSMVQGITGRTVLNLIPRKAPMRPDNLPVATHFTVVNAEAYGTSGHRDVRLQIEVWVEADSPTAISDMHTLLDRIKAQSTGPRLATQGVDASRNSRINRADGTSSDGVRSMRADLVFDLTE